jgi:outer membrane lipoprotein carrier protein
MNLRWKIPERGSEARSSVVAAARVWLLPAIFACLPWAVSADDPASAIGKLQQRYASVTSVAGDFRQTYRAPGIDVVESGVFWMQKPGLMRWEYRNPEPKLFIADGRETYLYTPVDRQVMVRRFNASELHSTPLEFLLGRGDILRTFTSTWEVEIKPALEGTVLFRLTPRADDLEYSYLVLECDQKTFELRRIVIRERTGNRSEFLLTNIRTNDRIDRKQFEFKIPKGVELIRLDSK